MLRPVRFPGSLFHSSRSFVRSMHASIGILLALALLLAIYHGSYARASEAGPLATNVVRTATDSNWRQSPSSVLSSAGRNSVTLNTCPPGVIAFEPWYYVFISGAGTPEAVKVIGGTCKGDGRAESLHSIARPAFPSS
jgi:hypothetical protein